MPRLEVRITMGVNNLPTVPWYESNLLWGPVALGVSILLTVVAAMMHDLRWLLWLALPCFLFACWSVGKGRTRPWWRWTLLAVYLVLACGGLYLISVRLRPTEESTNTKLEVQPSQVSSPPVVASSSETSSHGEEQMLAKAKPTTHGKTQGVTASGDNSVAVGTITQGSGSIAQVGGSGNIATVINGPKPLMLSHGRQTELASRLNGFSGESVEIDVNNATPETSSFANALISSLRLAGIGAKRNDGMFVGPCINYPGVSFMAGSSRTKLVQAIWNGLVAVKAVEPTTTIPGCSRSGEPDELHIRIFAQ